MPESVTPPVLTDDAPCAHCGYNLRGLQPSGFCPECAAPVERSVFGDQLQYADLQWLERIRLGLSLSLWSIGIIVMVNVGAFISAFVGPQFGVLNVIGTVAGVVGVSASFAITTLEPRISLHEDTVTWRKTIRVCAAIGLVGIVLGQVEWFGSTLSIVVASSWAVWLVGVFTMFGELLYLSRFAPRVPDPKLEHSTRTVMWGFTISWVLFVGARTCDHLLVAPIGRKQASASASVSSWSLSIAWALAFIAGLALAVFWIWRIVLLVRYRRAFTAAVDEGRAMGTAGDTPVPPPSA